MCPIMGTPSMPVPSDRGELLQPPAGSRADVPASRGSPGSVRPARADPTRNVAPRSTAAPAWEVFGQGEPTIFFLPTWSIVHCRIWKAQVPHLARQARVVTMDGRGNGGSDRPPTGYDEREFAADNLAVMDATGTTVTRTEPTRKGKSCSIGTGMQASLPDPRGRLGPARQASPDVELPASAPGLRGVGLTAGLPAALAVGAAAFRLGARLTPRKAMWAPTALPGAGSASSRS